MVTVLLVLDLSDVASLVNAERLIDSVYAQAGSRHLVVVVAGEKTPVIDPLLARFGKADCITWCRFPPLRHASLALNLALAYAPERTTLISVALPEYTYLPGAFALARAAQAQRPELGLFYGDEDEYDLHGMPVDWTPRLPEYDRHVLLTKLGWFHFPATFFNYRLLLGRGGFELMDEQAPDWDMALRLSHYGVGYLRRPVVAHYWPTTFPIEDWPTKHSAIQERLRAGMYGDAALAQATAWRAFRQGV